MPINFQSPGFATGGAEAQAMMTKDIQVSSLAGQQIENVKGQIRTQQLRETLIPILSNPGFDTATKMKLSQNVLGKYDSLKAYDMMVDQYKLEQQRKQTAETQMFQFFSNQLGNVTTEDQGELLVGMAKEALRGTAYEPFLQNMSVVVKPDKTVVVKKPVVQGNSVILKEFNRVGQLVNEENVTDKYYKQVDNPQMGVTEFIPTPEGANLGLKTYKTSITVKPLSARETEGDKKREEFGAPLLYDSNTGKYKIANITQADKYEKTRIDFGKKSVVDLREAYYKLSTMGSLLKSKSLIAPNAVMFAVAKLLNGTGVLTDRDFDRAELDPTFVGKVNSIVTRKTLGKLTASEKKSVVDFLKAMEPIVKEKYAGMVDNAGISFSQISGVPREQGIALFRQDFLNSNQTSKSTTNEGVSTGASSAQPTRGSTFKGGGKVFQLPN